MCGVWGGRGRTRLDGAESPGYEREIEPPEEALNELLEDYQGTVDLLRELELPGPAGRRAGALRGPPCGRLAGAGELPGGRREPLADVAGVGNHQKATVFRDRKTSLRGDLLRRACHGRKGAVAPLVPHGRFDRRRSPPCRLSVHINPTSP